MAQAIPFIAAAVAGGGQAIAAYKKSKYHERQALEYRKAKNRRMAATTREIAEANRKKEFVHSRAVAVAAASGAGTEGLVKHLSDLNAEGEYRVMSLLWQGKNDADGLLAQARAEHKAANDAISMGIVKTITSAFSAFISAGGSMPSFGDTPGAGPDILGGTDDLGGLYQSGTLVDGGTFKGPAMAGGGVVV